MKNTKKIIPLLCGLSLILAGCNSALPLKQNTDQINSTQFKNTDNIQSSSIDEDLFPIENPIKLPPKTDFGNNSGVAPVTTTVSPPPASKDLKEVGIAITKNGFKPALITIAPGTKVVFINLDSEPHWPASDPHPNHGLCKGFDAKKALAKGQSYSFTFLETKTCTYHDHLNSALKGTISIK